MRSPVVAPEPLREAAIKSVVRALAGDDLFSMTKRNAEDLVDTITAHILSVAVELVMAELKAKGVISGE